MSRLRCVLLSDARAKRLLAGCIGWLCAIAWAVPPVTVSVVTVSLVVASPVAAQSLGEQSLGELWQERQALLALRKEGLATPEDDTRFREVDHRAMVQLSTFRRELQDGNLPALRRELAAGLELGALSEYRQVISTARQLALASGDRALIRQVLAQVPPSGWSSAAIDLALAQRQGALFEFDTREAAYRALDSRSDDLLALLLAGGSGLRLQAAREPSATLERLIEALPQNAASMPSLAPILRELLSTAVARDDVDLLEALETRSPLPENAGSLCTRAVSHDSAEILRVLLSRRAADCSVERSMPLAIRSGKGDVVDALLAAGADLETYRDEILEAQDGRLARELIARRSTEDRSVAGLASTDEAGADEARVAHGRPLESLDSALVEAIEGPALYAFPETFLLLLAGADPNATAADLLTTASAQGRVDLVWLLREFGATETDRGTRAQGRDDLAEVLWDAFKFRPETLSPRDEESPALTALVPSGFRSSPVAPVLGSDRLRAASVCCFDLHVVIEWDPSWQARDALRSLLPGPSREPSTAVEERRARPATRWEGVRLASEATRPAVQVSGVRGCHDVSVEVLGPRALAGESEALARRIFDSISSDPCVPIGPIRWIFGLLCCGLLGGLSARWIIRRRA